MLKHLPIDSLKKIEKTLLYNKKPVYFNKTTIGRKIHDGSGAGTTGTAAQIATRKANDAKDLNIEERISKFQSQLRDEYVYRIPLRYFTDLGKINFPLKIDFRIKCHLETDLKKIFESKKVLAAAADIPSPDAKIIFTKAHFIQRKQLLLDKNFRQYLETIMVSKKILRIGTQETPIQKTYEIIVGQDSINIDFLGSNRQFDWLEISMVYDKTDKHTNNTWQLQCWIGIKIYKISKTFKFHWNLQLNKRKKNLTWTTWQA